MNQFKPDCLIIAPNNKDPQSVTLYEELVTRGKHPYILPFKSEEKEIIHKIIFSNDELIYGEDLSDVKAVYIRCLSTSVPPSIPPLLNQMEFCSWQAKFLKEELKQKVFASLITLLQQRGALIINPPSSYFHHNTKGQFFSNLASAGLSVPPSFSTNDKKFLEKYAAQYSSLIVKAGYGVGGTRRFQKDTPVDEDELAYCPAVFQNEVNGSTIRVHTVGSKVILALRIISNDIDSRTDAKGFEVIQLSPEHKEMINRANKFLNLQFSAWDVIIDKLHNIYLLDCNPGPYIWWIGPYYSRIVLSNLAELISSYIDHGSIKEYAFHAEMALTLDFPNVYKQVEKVSFLNDEISNRWKSSLRLRN